MIINSYIQYHAESLRIDGGLDDPSPFSWIVSDFVLTEDGDLLLL